MKVRILREFIDDMFLPHLDWLQVEITSRCNAACFYCPRTLYGSAWQNRHLALDVYKKLLPALKYTGLAYLQGWGEPFLHPDFLTMVDLAKKSGCQVGTTTNGTLVDDEKSRQIASSGLDVISFSLAGTSAQNDHFRRGTSLSGVLRAIKSVAAAREKANSGRPEIHVSYLLLKSNLADLQRLPDMLAGTGVAEVIVSTLDFIPDKSLAGEAFHSGDKSGLAGARSLLWEVSLEAEKRGLKIHHRLPGDETTAYPCTENPLRSAFVSAGGSVTPCVFKCLPVDPKAVSSEAGLPNQPRTVFGSLAEESFSAIWRKKDYQAFRGGLEAGRLEPSCKSCLKSVFGS